MPKKSDDRIKLTKTHVEAIPVPEAGERITWDDTLTGYGVRVAASGRRTYFIQSRTRAGRQVKMKIGVHGAMTAERARDVASRFLGKIAAGEDPAEDRRQAKAAETKRLATPTVAALCDRYLSEHAEVHKRPISVRDDRAMIDKIIKPAIGTKRVPEVERADVAALHRKMKATPYRANRALALLSKIFSLAAVEWGLRSDNPVRGVKRYPEEPRQKYLSPDQLAKLAEALAVHSNQTTADAIRMLLMTGARRGEVMAMTWQQVDEEPGTWIKPSAHTKTKREHRVPLSPGAREIIERLRAYRKGRDPYVFPGRSRDERPIADLKATWHAVTKAAGITGYRLHDLRHTYASLLVNSGHSLPLIGALLGHTQVKTTARYAHLADAALREATERVSNQLAALNKPTSPAPERLARRR